MYTDLNKALYRGAHGVVVTFFVQFNVVRLENDVVRLGESHHEDQIDYDESEKIIGHHTVDHSNEWTCFLETSEKEK